MSASNDSEIDQHTEVEEVEVKTDQPSSKEKKSMLSMLAEVASATLSPPNSKNKASNIQLSGKTIEQLKSLKPATLVELFAVYKSDEMKKKFTYTCNLIPEKCRTTFTSHGNELRARQQIRAHLTEHLEEITRDVDLFEEEISMETSDIPITRRTRTGSESSATMSASEQEDNVEQGEDGILLFHTRYLDPKLDGHDWSSLEELGDHYYTHPCGPPEIPFPRSMISEISIDEEGNNLTEPKRAGLSRQTIMTAQWPAVYTPLLPNISEIVDIVTFVPPPPPPPVIYEEDSAQNIQYIVQDYHEPQAEPGTRYVYEDENGMLYEYDQPIEEEPVAPEPVAPQNAQRTVHIVVDRETGEEYAIEYQDTEGREEEYEEMSYQSTSKDYVVEGDDVVVYGDSSQEVGEDETVQWTDEEVAEQEISTNFSPFEGRIVYTTQQPRSVKSKGRTSRTQTAVSQICDEQMSAVSAIQGDETPRVHNGRVIPEWEQKLAIQCLDALNERTEPDFVLQCKICNNNKTFTAAATLISHYRSHAGIKPFKCNICHATFTRQHSLKYHMLIHNNASRFTCMECSRQFRHPSHFKEHMRRHTGETPFECEECGQKFKTRNTFKRHLKTRHNKLLSKDGIVELTTLDEYADADNEEVTEMVVIGEEYDELG